MKLNLACQSFLAIPLRRSLSVPASPNRTRPRPSIPCHYSPCLPDRYTYNPYPSQTLPARIRFAVPAYPCLPLPERNSPRHADPAMPANPSRPVPNSPGLAALACQCGPDQSKPGLSMPANYIHIKQFQITQIPDPQIVSSQVFPRQFLLASQHVKLNSQCQFH